MPNKYYFNLIYTIFFSYFPITSFCDSPVAINNSSFEGAHFLDHLGFQEPASPLMEGLIALHSDIWAIMLFVAGFVLYTVCATLYSFDANNTTASYKVHHHSLIEVVWTTIPAILLCIIAVPSFTLLYSLDEIVEPSLTIKAIGRQWYWSYEYGDYEVCNSCSNSTGIASPHESNSGWFRWFKNWVSDKASPESPLSPLQSQQQGLDIVQKYVKEQTAQYSKYSDQMTASSPRTANVLAAGRAFADRVGQVAGTMFEEVASNGIQATAENANSR